MFSYILRMTLQWLTLLVLIGRSRGETNILLNKTVVTITKFQSYASYFNDDSDRTCLTFDVDSKKMVVYDLGKIYQIDKIVINNNRFRSQKPTSFYLGNEYRPCAFKAQFRKFKKCNEFTQTAYTNEITCTPGSNMGRYLVLLKGDVFIDEQYEEISICEIRVYGSVVKDSEVTETRPEVQSKMLFPILKSSFKTSIALRNNVPNVTIPYYSNGIIYINKFCEPIIYQPAKKLAFGVACESRDQKARGVVFGKYGYFASIFTEPAMSQFKSNLVEWLSPKTKNSDYVTSTNLKTMEDFEKLIKPGTIVYFEVSDQYSDDIIEKLESAIRDGTVSLALDMNFWNPVSEKARNIYMKILNIFNVDFVMTYVTWSSPVESTMPDSIYGEELLGLEERVNRMLQNHAYLISQYSYFTDVFTKYPTHMLQNSQIGFYLKEILNKYQDLLEWICPCELKGASDPVDRNLIRILGEIMKNQLLVNSNFEAPCVKLFPGDYKSPPVKNAIKLTVTGVTASTKNPIGYYLEAGNTLEFSVKESSGKWTMSVGCHSDNLPDRLDGWYRYPNVYVTDIPVVGSGEVFSPFGGVLWLTNEAVNSSITLTITNVIATPFFNIREENPAAKWNERRNNPGLWAQIAGDSIVFCEASYRVKNFDGSYLEELLSKTWDPIVRSESIMTGNNWFSQRPQITVLDIMISFGYGHSGYPIEVYPSWYNMIFNATFIKQHGSWGMCHEIGHNMQRNKWTFTGTVEVTNNLFCLLVFDKVFKLPRYGLDLNNINDKKSGIIKYLNDGAKFEQWKDDPWVGLSIYAQFVHHFGWGFFKSVFEYYEKNSINPTTDDLKMQTFMNISSVITGQNLLVIFDFWGFVINEDLNSFLSNLPCFFPSDDYFSNLSETRTKYIKDKYPNCNGKSIYFKEYLPEEYIKGNRPNFIKEIERKKIT